MAKHGEPEAKSAEQVNDDLVKKDGVEEMKPEPTKPRASPRVKAAKESAGPIPEPKPASVPLRKLAPEPVQAARVPRASAVRLDVFCRITGIKWDRLAAFRFWVRKQRIGPLPIKGWWLELDRFRKRPVG
jgi:hypothetical protein